MKLPDYWPLLLKQGTAFTQISRTLISPAPTVTDVRISFRKQMIAMRLLPKLYIPLFLLIDC